MYLILIVLVFVVIYLLFTYNKLIELNNNTKEAFATMDVYLKKRWDLIPHIVEIVKGYAKHEKETLNDIVSLRSGIDYDMLSVDDKISKNNEISKSVIKLMALTESYPNLKANENFLSLNNELSSIEDEIAQSRKYYNAVVRNFNNKVEMVPSNIVAKMMGLTTKQMFVADEKERASIKVKL